MDITLEHVTEGYLVVEELAKEKVKMAVGPSFCSGSKLEFQNVSMENAGILANAGCHVCIVTDAPVVPLQGLPMFAGMAVKAGMDEYDALRAITINAAEHLGIEKRVGSLEEGKDADLVAVSGSPFSTMGEVRFVFIDGKQILE
ncbi:MAG: amidohydrolase family protein [Brotaphodocola sp.]